MYRGAAVAQRSTIYCVSRHCDRVYSYDVNKNDWRWHSYCPHINAGLAIINELLTAIGGEVRLYETNKVVSWKENEKKWVEEFPPMKTARRNHAVVNNDHYVIAAGGDNNTSVEIFAISSKTWSTLTNFPRSLDPSFISATLCGDSVYVLDRKGRTYSFSLPSSLRMDLTNDELAKLLSDTSIGGTLAQLPPDIPTATKIPSDTSAELPHNTPTADTPDTPTADTPAEFATRVRNYGDAEVRCSTLSTLCGAVIAIGGHRGFIATSDTYELCKRKWVRRERMDTARSFPITAACTLPGGKPGIVVVGGSIPLHQVPTCLDSVECCRAFHK